MQVFDAKDSYHARLGDEGKAADAWDRRRRFLQVTGLASCSCKQLVVTRKFEAATM
jgi:hypothetical protein